jgi:hypothetical protein
MDFLELLLPRIALKREFATITCHGAQSPGRYYAESALRHR